MTMAKADLRKENQLLSSLSPHITNQLSSFYFKSSSESPTAQGYIIMYMCIFLYFFYHFNFSIRKLSCNVQPQHLTPIICQLFYFAVTQQSQVNFNLVSFTWLHIGNFENMYKKSHAQVTWDFFFDKPVV